MDLWIDDSSSCAAIALTAKYAEVSKNLVLKTAEKKDNIPIPSITTTDSGTLTQPTTIMRYLAFLSNHCKALEGTSAIEKSMIDQFLSLASERHFAINEATGLSAVETSLTRRTFLAGHHITLADLAIYPSIHKWMKESTASDRKNYHNITRWFNHVQFLPGIVNSVNSLPLIQINECNDSKCSIPMAASRASDVKHEDMMDGLATRKPRGGKEATEKKDNKEKKDKEKKEKPKKTPQPSAESARPVNDVTRLDVRVGIIKKVWRHPDAEKLYCEEIDIGEEKPRSIASGLVPYMTEEQMLNQKILVLANMKPKNLRGFPSHGMVLCASSADKQKTEFLRPPSDTPVGERVCWEGLSGEADPVMNTKTGKDPFVEVQPSFRTSEDKLGFFMDHVFTTSKGPCYCESIKGGIIS